MPLQLPPLTPPITGHYTPDGYVYQRTSDGYIRQKEIITSPEFTHCLLERETVDYIEHLSDIVDRPSSDLFRTYLAQDHAELWLHPSLAVHLTSFKKPNLSVCIASITQARYQLYFNYIVGLDISSYEFTQYIRDVLSELDIEGYLDKISLRIITIRIHGSRVYGKPDFSEPVYITIEYVSSITPSAMKELVQKVLYKVEGDFEALLEFRFKNLRHPWW